MEELIEKLKVELIEALNLEEITPEDIDRSTFIRRRRIGS